MKIFGMFLALLFGSCSCTGDNDRGIVCTEEARAGLNVRVKDAATGNTLGTGITVTATDGSYTETLVYFESPGTFTGAWERAGNYILTVTGEGYEDYISGIIAVDADVCHVIAQNITLEVQPQE